MKQYRLGYDFILLPNGSLSYKDDYIGSMCINVLFKVFDDNGQELFFESNDDKLPDQVINLENGETCYLYQMITCSFDKENILTFEPDISLLRNFKYSLEWEIVTYWKDLTKGIVDEPMKITESEFMDIMRNNIDTFDNSNNRSAQTTAYFTQEIEKEQFKS